MGITQLRLNGVKLRFTAVCAQCIGLSSGMYYSKHPGVGLSGFQILEVLLYV